MYWYSNPPLFDQQYIKFLQEDNGHDCSPALLKSMDFYAVLFSPMNYAWKDISLHFIFFTAVSSLLDVRGFPSADSLHPAVWLHFDAFIAFYTKWACLTCHLLPGINYSLERCTDWWDNQPGLRETSQAVFGNLTKISKAISPAIVQRRKTAFPVEMSHKQSITIPFSSRNRN